VDAGPDGGRRPINLTQGLKDRFENERHDTPDLPGAYGIAGWTAGDASLVVYDRFDLWELKPGGARNLTTGQGRAQRTALRYLRLDPDEKTLPTDQPLLLSGVNEDTSATGFFRAAWDASGPKRLIWGDQLMGGLVKAKNADTIVFTRSASTCSPTSGPATSPSPDPEGDGCQSPTVAVQLGHPGTDDLRERRRQAAAGPCGQARELRPEEEVPAHGLHL